MNKHPRITVLHVINSLETGGAETLLVNFARVFDDPRFAIEIAYLIGKGTLAGGQGPGSPVHDLSDHGRFTPRAFPGLISLIRRKDVRIVHTHDPQGGIMARFAAWSCRKPLIVTTRHSPVLIGRHPLAYRIENLLLKRTPAVIAISEAVRSKLLQDRHVSPARIRVIHNGVDTAFFSPKRTGMGANKGTGPVILGSVGRLIRQKGFDILISAAGILSQSFRNFEVRIVGSGPEEGVLADLIARLGMGGTVKLEGNRSPAGVRDFLEDIDIFVLASRWEGFGMAIVEAMAMSKPVLASATDGVPEIIDDGFDGMLFRTGDAEDLSGKLARLIADPAMRGAIASRARMKVETAFSLERYCRQTAEVYYELIATTEE